MLKNKMFILFLVLCSRLSLGDPLPSGSKVVVLNDASFEEVTESGYWLVEFYSPDCHHCNELAPVWEELASRLAMTSLKNPSLNSVRLAKLDGTLNPKLIHDYEIRFYPTIKLFADGELMADFPGDQISRNFANIVAWLERELPKDLHFAIPQVTRAYAFLRVHIKQFYATIPHRSDSKISETDQPILHKIETLGTQAMVRNMLKRNTGSTFAPRRKYGTTIRLFLPY